MQQVTGGKGRGAGGMPTPAQLQAMQVSLLHRLGFDVAKSKSNDQRSLPPGMLQQMQRQLKGNNGLQEMMKTMMQGQGGDQFDVEEMQSKLWLVNTVDRS